MITLRAPQRSEPKHRPPARPDLRVIEKPDKVGPGRDGSADLGADEEPRSHGGLVGTLFVVLLFVCIFGLVVFQVFLVQTQSHLDDLGTRISHEENRTKALRLDTTDLESPDRIVADAKDRLGMIPPPEIAYLKPGAADDAAAAYDPVKEPPPTTPTTVAGPAAGGKTGAAGSTGAAPTAPKAPSAPAPVKSAPTTIKSTPPTRPATTATTIKPVTSKPTDTTKPATTTATTAKPKTTTTMATKTR